MVFAYIKLKLKLHYPKKKKIQTQEMGIQNVGTKGVSQNHLLSFDNNKVLKVINWTC